MTPASRLLAMVALTAALAAAASASADAAPPAASLPVELRTVAVAARGGVVACAAAGAAEAGARVLAAGGNAVDAAVAAAFALGVAEPGASGLGGMTYMLVCLVERPCVAIDGSALVPMGASRLELKRMVDAERFYGHRTVAAPATVAALAHALARYGTISLAEALAPAIDLADGGVPFSAAQRSYAEGYLDKLRESPYLSNLLLRDGLYVRPAEHVYCFADLACTLRRLAALGAGDFYSGITADAIVADMAAQGGWLRHADLARVRAVEHEPVRGEYRGVEVVSFPTPGGGGAVVEALQILDHLPADALCSEGFERQRLLIEATRLALADESRIMVPVPAAAQELGSRERAAQRARMIRADRALTAAELGGIAAPPWYDRDTTQLAVADRHGNLVAVTQTLGRIFGSYSATPGLGFPYNGALEMFTFDKPASRHYLKPLQVPFTTMAPTILRRNGRPFAALGSVGSGRITSAIVLAVSNLLDRRMELADAVAAPRVLWGGTWENRVLVELAGDIDAGLADALQTYGYAENMFRLAFPADQGGLNVFGAVNAVMVRADGTAVGVGDPRRGGAAAAPAGKGAALVPLFPACWRTAGASR
jgi:gamma-glutamyltranspeptidase/glutathione hydrolase